MVSPPPASNRRRPARTLHSVPARQREICQGVISFVVGGLCLCLGVNSFVVGCLGFCSQAGRAVATVSGRDMTRQRDICQGINSFVVDGLGICQGFNRFTIGRCALSSTV
jgi:hypothetical protein